VNFFIVRPLHGAALLTMALLLAACGTVPMPRDDGATEPAPTQTPVPAPVPAPPPAALPAPAPAHKASPSADAVPRIERIAKGAPNARYQVAGERYEPESSDVPMSHSGIASWYGEPFHGRLTANGETYDMHAMTAAHKTMPLPSYARVRNKANGREIVVRVNDRGPFKPGRVIDLSQAAAKRLGIAGLGEVEVTRITHAAIRSGAWKRDGQRQLLATVDSAD
jgi:rare lipoprotein A